MKPSPRSLIRALALGLCALALPAQALLLIHEEVPKNMNVDHRAGKLLPTPAQLAAVDALGATAEWNQFGTVHSMIRHGGFLGTGYAGSPEQAARAFVMANRSLFKLSEGSVRGLKLVSDGVMPGNKGHAILFRQDFYGMPATLDAQITVGVVEGKVYYVSSSSAGDQAPPGPAKIGALDAWMLAAADVKRSVPLSAVIGVADRMASRGWHMIAVEGFAQPQRARLVAVPMPAGGVRQAWETIVLDVQGARAQAYVSFVDAESGSILRREDRVDWQSQPTVESYQGEFAAASECGAKHPFDVPAGQKQIVVIAAAANGANDVSINLYYNGVLIASNDLGTSPETLTYTPATGVLPGVYDVEVCPFGDALPPFNYAGTFAYSDTTSPASLSLPQWKWNPAYPDVDYLNVDTRKLGCWIFDTGCDYEFINVAARAPWDVNINTGQSSLTTIGNNAITAEAWGSPLTPAEMYRPVAPDRKYIFPFTNVWNSSKCSPNNLVPRGNDIDASITNLFVFHNRMHDWSYHLGFTERNSNLQTSNFGNTETTRENDAEIGNVQAGAISGSPGSPSFYQAPGRDNANQIALQDGVPGITNQYLFQSLGGSLYAPCADADFDMSVVGHEYTHAISNRMIGGPDASIGGEQGDSMGESWSDLDAAEYMYANGYVPSKDESPTSVGPYATGDKKLGIRTYALDDNPLNYSNYGYDTPGPEVHSDGEIWNAVQWDLRQAFMDKYEAEFPVADRKRQQDCADGKYQADECPGNRRWIQLMFDSFLLVPAAPSMLDARDATLAADMARFGGANQALIWHVFASRGMGVDAFAADANDVAPVGNFASPLETNATVTFQVSAGDEGNTAITKARILIGQYAIRTRPIADTDPMTLPDTTTAATRRKTSNTLDSARILPGTYDFIVVAPGYGIHKFERRVVSDDSTISFVLPTNWASKDKGASVVTTAAQEVNIGAKDQLIDDEEGTGVRFGDAAPVLGKYAIVKLGGSAPRLVSSVNVSTAATPGEYFVPEVDDPKPSNGGRFTGVRKFEIRVCNGTCANADADFTTLAYTSLDDAFPGKPLRPTQPNLTTRSFSFAPVLATHVMLRALTNQCTGQTLFHGDKDSDPSVNADCPSFVPSPTAGVNAIDMEITVPVAPSTIVRASEIQVFTTQASSGGMVAPASSSSSSSSSGGSSSGAATSSSGSTSSSSGAATSSSGGSISPTAPANTATTSSSDTAGRFGGGAFGLALMLPGLLLALSRKRRV